MERKAYHLLAFYGRTSDNLTQEHMYKCLSILLLLLCFGCSKTPAAPSAPLLLVSIAPYRFLTERIAGSEFEVHTLVPTAANPHSFEPTAAQVAKMGRGLVWFRIGEPFERKILPLLEEHSPELKIKDLRDGIALIGHDCCEKEGADRHIWMSPKKAIEQAAMIAETLSCRFPEKRALFEENLGKLRGELAALDLEIAQILKPVIHRTILVSHPAFGYFCQEYNFRQVSVEHEGKDPRPKHLEEILAAAQGLDVALALPQHNNKGAQMIAEKLHVPIRWVDPYSPDYFETMRTLAHTLAGPACKSN
jgi:zinc transport system substrate-binding protein